VFVCWSPAVSDGRGNEQRLTGAMLSAQHPRMGGFTAAHCCSIS